MLQLSVFCVHAERLCGRLDLVLHDVQRVVGKRLPQQKRCDQQTLDAIAAWRFALALPLDLCPEHNEVRPR